MSPARSALIEPTRERGFSDFLRRHEPGLRRALVARYGPEIGREAAADALTYAWQHWDRLGRMANPAGYLYQVGQSKSRRFRRHSIAFPAPEDHGLPWVEPALAPALAALPARQRQTVVLVHGFAYTQRRGGGPARAVPLLGPEPRRTGGHRPQGATRGVPCLTSPNKSAPTSTASPSAWRNPR